MPLPALKTLCGLGFGVAACPALGLLVTSDDKKNTLSVWDLGGGASVGGASGGAGAPGVGGASAGGSGGDGGLRLVCTLGGPSTARSAAPMQFQFWDGQGSSGYLSFILPATTSLDSSSAHPLLLVTDAGADAVHLVDVVGRSHAGYLACPGSIAGPRGVAASEASPLVAVSAWKRESLCNHVVMVYRGSGAAWEAVRVIGCGFRGPGKRDG